MLTFYHGLDCQLLEDGEVRALRLTGSRPSPLCTNFLVLALLSQSTHELVLQGGGMPRRRSLQLTLAHADHPLLTLQLPARPETFLDAFYLSRDDPKSVQPTA